MTTATQSRPDYEREQTKHRQDAELHEAQIPSLKAGLAEIKNQRGDRPHLDKLLAGDSTAKKRDKSLADDEAEITRQIELRDRLASDSRRKAEILTPKIIGARMFEAVALASALAVSWENSTLAFLPLIEEVLAESKKFEAGRVALENAFSGLSETAQRQLGKYFLQTFNERFRSALSAELHRIVTGVSSSNSRGSDFFATTSALFTRLELAFATLASTAAGGGEGRRLFAAVGNVPGISGGLNLRDGDRVFLLANDDETKNMVALKGLVEVVPEEVTIEKS